MQCGRRKAPIWDGHDLTEGWKTGALWVGWGMSFTWEPGRDPPESRRSFMYWYIWEGDMPAGAYQNTNTIRNPKKWCHISQGIFALQERRVGGSWLEGECIYTIFITQLNVLPNIRYESYMYITTIAKQTHKPNRKKYHCVHCSEENKLIILSTMKQCQKFYFALGRYISVLRHVWAVKTPYHSCLVEIESCTTLNESWASKTKWTLLQATSLWNPLIRIGVDWLTNLVLSCL